MTNNKVFANADGYTEMIWDGDQTGETVFDTIKESVKYNDALSSKGLPIKVLVDLTKVTSLDIGAEKQGVGAVSVIPFDKAAMYGGSDEIMEKVWGIIKYGGGEEKSKMFATREEAVEWLKNI